MTPLATEFRVRLLLAMLVVSAACQVAASSADGGCDRGLAGSYRDREHPESRVRRTPRPDRQHDRAHFGAWSRVVSSNQSQAMSSASQTSAFAIGSSIQIDASMSVTSFRYGGPSYAASASSVLT